jgi:cobalt-precorrin 5A hydrolase
MRKIALISINKPGLKAALKLKEILSDFEITVFCKEGKGCREFDSIDEVIKTLWEEFDAGVFFISIGIIIRKIAPYLKSKTIDPAIISMSINLDRVVPMIGGHIGGANELSKIIEKRIDGCINFITTATDQTDTFAFDMFAKKEGFLIKNINKLANISNRLINNKRVKVATYQKIYKTIDCKNLELIDFDKVDSNSVIIAPHINSSVLTLKPSIYLGIGCKKDISIKTLHLALNDFLHSNNLQDCKIGSIASFDKKSDEKALIDLSSKLGVGFETFRKSEIDSLKTSFSKSASKKYFDIKGVAEPCAILASRYKIIIIKKTKFFNSITIACAI